MTADIKALVERLERAGKRAQWQSEHQLLADTKAALTAQSALLDNAVEAERRLAILLRPFALDGYTYQRVSADGWMATLHDESKEVAAAIRARSTAPTP